MTERVVLAYAGGLDTSVAIGRLAEETGAEVIAVAVDVGQGGEDLDVIRERALDGFLDEANRYVTGDIRVTPHGGRAVVTGRRSDVSLYDFNLAPYDSGGTFDESKAQGFIEIFGLSSKIAARRDLA